MTRCVEHLSRGRVRAAAARSRGASLAISSASAARANFMKVAPVMAAVKMWNAARARARRSSPSWRSLPSTCRRTERQALRCEVLAERTVVPFGAAVGRKPCALNLEMQLRPERIRAGNDQMLEMEGWIARKASWTR